MRNQHLFCSVSWEKGEGGGRGEGKERERRKVGLGGAVGEKAGRPREDTQTNKQTEIKQRSEVDRWTGTEETAKKRKRIGEDEGRGTTKGRKAMRTKVELRVRENS